MEKKIYYHDTDAGGVVYYANYLKYMEEGRTEYFIQKGISLKDLQEERFLYAVRKCHVIYKSPARYGDTIVVKTKLEKISAAQIFFNQEVYERVENRLLVKAEVILVCLTPDFKAASVPDDIRSKLLA